MSTTVALRELLVGGLLLSATGAIAQDAYESDNTSGTARSISNDVMQNHSIHAVGDVDWVTFTVGANGASNVRIETDGAVGDTRIWLYGSNPTSVVNFISVLTFDDDSGNGSFSLITRPALSSGTYYVEVRENGDDATIPAYTLRVSWTDGGVAADSYEPDNSAGTAQPITNGEVQNRTIHTPGDDDWAKFTINSKGADNVRLSVSRNATAGDSEMWLYGPNSASTLVAHDDSIGSSGQSAINLSTLAGGTYYVRVAEYGGNGVWAAYTLRASWAPAGNGDIVIGSQPNSSTVQVGSMFSMSVYASGTSPFQYQWRKNGVAIPGAIENYITYTNVQVTDAGVYTVMVSNSTGSVISNDAVVNVTTPTGAPTIATQPVSRTVEAGENTTFSVAATGAATLTFQWKKDGVAVPGATSPTFTLANVQKTNAGNYTVVVANSAGSATSNAATLALVPESRLVNLSVRSAAGSGSQTLIVGFVITGSGSKQLLLRGIGPTLGSYGVSNALADPLLRLFNSSGVQVQANDDWGGSAELNTTFASLGAFALPAASKDAALFTPLAAGPSTFHIVANSGTGVALAELYDADSAAETAQLVNISARTQVDTGDKILIAGFVITGNVPKTVLIRGLGPTLTPYGVTGALADPQLKLYNSGVLVTSNDDWGGTADLKSVFATVGAVSLVSDTSKDAALLVTLPPGAYSAQVSGVNSTTGVGLVEVFAVP
jgi:hypothetical protein